MIEIAKPLTISQLAVMLLKRGLLSLGCAIAGWMIMIVCVYIHHFDHHVSGAWIPVWWGIAAYSSAIYIRIYFIFILPLFLLVRSQNYFWNIYICPLVLGSVGWIISKFGFGSLMTDPVLESFRLHVAIGSTATGLISAIVQRLITKKMHQPEFEWSSN